MQRLYISIRDSGVQRLMCIAHTKLTILLSDRIFAVPLPMLRGGHFDIHTIHFIPVLNTVLHEAAALL